MIPIAGADGPDDAAARRAIAERLDETLFVEAGAGTGKTTALVGRIVELVATGRASLRNIAAITFTEAAAGELRDRVREALELEAAGGEPERSARAADALTEIDAAALSTLHGFAQRILAEHPFEAGLPPTFEVFDEIRSAVAFDEGWQAFLDDLLDDESMRPTLQRALVGGVRLDQLRAIAAELNRNWDLVVDQPPQPVPTPTIDATPLVEALDRAHALAGVCIDPTDRLLGHLEGLEGLTRRLAAADADLEVLELLAGAPKLRFKNGRKSNWNGCIDTVHGALDQAESARGAIVEGVVRAALSELLVGLGRLTIEAAERRRREGGLEFHDLLVQARALLRSHPEVAIRLHDTYTHLLIDEFQDTDPIQLELAVRIACADLPSSERGLDWRDWPIPPGRLFFVGDPKQSIYRFRRADVGVFLTAREVYVDRPVLLTRNHRSVPGIVAWVNEVFGRLIGEGVAGSQPAYTDLAPHRAEPAAPSETSPAALPVVLLGDAIEALMPDVRVAEAADIADAVARVRDEGWAVGDQARRARLSDITILIPTRASLPSIERALDRAGLPYRVESSSLVYASPEVRDLLNVLRAIDDPTDEISIIAALRSPWFGCGDDDLLEFHAAGGGWDPRREPPETLDAEHPVVAGLRSLRALHDRRWWHDASGLIELVLVERRAFELGLDEHRPRDVWRRLRFVVDQARAFTDAYGADLRRYLHWADLQSADDARVVEAVLPESDDDAVRIMTVHASKGLEFPILFLAGLNIEDRGVSGVDVLWGPEGPEVKLVKELTTAGYAALATGETQHQADEQTRLLYVAATRARDHLVVSLHRKADVACPAARLAAICDELPSLWRRFEPRPARAGATPDHARTSEPEPRPTAPRPSARDAELVAAERTRWMRERAERLDQALVPRTLAATGVASLAAAGDPSEHDGPAGGPADDLVADPTGDDDRAPWRRGRAGTAIGRAVHAVLQVVDLETGDGLAELALAQAVAEGVVDHVRQIERLVRVALDSAIVRGAVTGGRFWRELYVGVPVGDRVLEGFVDLLVEGPDGLTVVDYKTDAVRSDGDLDAAVARYRPQGAAYAVALERVLGRPVDRCVFLFLRAGAGVEREVVELAAAKTQVIDLLASL